MRSCSGGRGRLEVRGYFDLSVLGVFPAAHFFNALDAYCLLAKKPRRQMNGAVATSGQAYGAKLAFADSKPKHSNVMHSLPDNVAARPCHDRVAMRCLEPRTR